MVVSPFWDWFSQDGLQPSPCCRECRRHGISGRWQPFFLNGTCPSGYGSGRSGNVAGRVSPRRRRSSATLAFTRASAILRVGRADDVAEGLPRNAHAQGGLLLIEFLKVGEANRLQFVQGQACFAKFTERNTAGLEQENSRGWPEMRRHLQGRVMREMTFLKLAYANYNSWFLNSQLFSVRIFLNSPFSLKRQRAKK